jgi:citrate synthase
MNTSDTKATLSFSDGSPSVDMPIYKGTIGPDVIDIRKLYGQTGKFTYDPGFISTATRASCCTAATRSSSWLKTATSSNRATCC